MTQRDAQQLDRIIGQMTDAEKKHLVDRLARSLGSGKHRPAAVEDMTAEEQKRTIVDVLQEVQTLPCSDEPDDGLVASKDHDQVLYDGSNPTGFPERPLR